MTAGTCPACGRPVAVARAKCLYCGAALSTEAVAAAQAATRAVVAPQAEHALPERGLVVVDLQGHAAPRVAEALGVPIYDAAQLVRRGGLHLHRVLGEAEAEAETAAVKSRGLSAWHIRESEAREAAAAIGVAGGLLEGETLALKTPAGLVRVGPQDLLLVVRGPIAREYQARSGRQKVETATLDGGFRFHLHRRTERAPLELDPAAFAFREPVAAGSSLLELTQWVAAASHGVPTDDGFRRLAPALAPSIEPAGLSALAGVAATRTSKDEARVILDNAAQFRSYSGWRAAAERKRLAQADPGTR